MKRIAVLICLSLFVLGLSSCDDKRMATPTLEGEVRWTLFTDSFYSNIEQITPEGERTYITVNDKKELKKMQKVLRGIKSSGTEVTTTPPEQFDLRVLLWRKDTLGNKKLDLYFVGNTIFVLDAEGRSILIESTVDQVEEVREQLAGYYEDADQEGLILTVVEGEGTDPTS